MLAAICNHLQWDARRICTDELVKFTQVSSADTRAWSHKDEHEGHHFDLPDCHFLTGWESQDGMIHSHRLSSNILL